jgi:uncharacterized protein
MQSSFFIRIERKNIYLINIQKRAILLVHPYVPFIYFERQTAQKAIAKEDMEYYEKKIAYYQKHGILSEKPFLGNEQLYLSPELIEESICNLKQIVFETTEKCNLQCKYCYYGEYYHTAQGRKNHDMPIKYAQKIIEYLSNKQLSGFNQSWNHWMYVSFYGGEPLLNTSLIDSVIQAGKMKNRKITFSMTTNATLLDKNISLLVDNDIQLTVSLDGNKENNSYRVFHNKEQAFDTILSNLKNLQNQYPKYFEKNVKFNAVLHNKNSVQEIYDFFQTVFDKDPSISELNNSGITDKKADDFYATYRNKNESLMHSENYEKFESEMFLDSPSYHSALIFLHQYLQFVYKSYEDLLAGEDRKLWTSTGTCIPFSRKIFISANGKILPCEKIAQKYAIGNVDESGVHLNTKEIADKYNIYYETLSKQCVTCYRQQACSQCIFFLEDLEENPKCHGYMDKNGMERYLRNNLSFFESHPNDYHRIMKEVIIS